MKIIAFLCAIGGLVIAVMMGLEAVKAGAHPVVYLYGAFGVFIFFIGVDVALEI